MLLTKSEAARLLKVKERTIDAWIAKGLLRPRKLGPRLNRFHVADLEKFMKLPSGSLRDTKASVTNMRK